MAYPSVTYANLVNGQTSDADQLDTNFQDIINGLSDGTKDLNVNNLTIAGTLTIPGTFSLLSSLNLTGNIVLSGYIEIQNGSKASPSIRGASGSANSGFYFKTTDEPCITAGGVDVFRWRADGQIDCGVGAEDDDHNSGTSTADFNYRGQTIRCVSATTTAVTIAALNRSATSAADAVLKAETDVAGGDPYVFLSVNATGFSIGIDRSVSTSNLYFCAGSAGVDTGTATIRGAIIGAGWVLGTDTNTTAEHKAIGASFRIESAHASTGPLLQMRSLRTAVGAGESIGGLEFYSSDATAGGAGVQADIRAVETGGTGVNYYLSFRAGASTVLTEGLRLIETGRALFVNGTSAAPAIAAISDTNTGIQFGGGDDIYLVAGGTARLQVLSTKIIASISFRSGISGSFGAPDFTHDSDSDTGLVFGQANDIYLSAGGSNRIAANATGVAFNAQSPIARPDYTVTNVTTDRTYDANATTTDELADVLGTLIADLTSYGLLQ